MEELGCLERTNEEHSPALAESVLTRLSPSGGRQDQLTWCPDTAPRQIAPTSAPTLDPTQSVDQDDKIRIIDLE